MKHLEGIALAAFAGCISIALLPSIQADTAVQIAVYTKTPVPTIEVETKAVKDLKTAPLVIVDEPPAATPQPAQSEPSQPVELSQTAERQIPTPAEPQQTLLQTASGLPLLGLIGILSLAVLVAFRSRSSPN